jgi:lanthanide-dependent methanol dehydrogenase
MYRILSRILIGAELLLVPLAASANDELNKMSQNPREWVMPAGDYASTRYSKLSEINAANVGKLQVAWTFSTGVLRGHEGGPLIIGNMMYVHTPFPNKVYALDASQDGKIVWKYEPKQDPNVVPVMCCDTVNRGLAYGDGKIFLHQADTTLVALDAKTGNVVWTVKNGDPSKGSTGTSAPLVVKDKVLLGISGGEFGVQCHLTAYDIKTGKHVWRAFSEGPDDQIMFDPEKTTDLGRPVGRDSSLKTWQGDQWKIGGGCTWGWMSYDPSLDLVYYGSGNPSTWNPKQRPGDNKWSMTIFARNPDTGVAKWVYQMTPHDEWDYDGVNEMILTDQQVGGAARKLLTHFDRNGLGYTLDRATGELLVAEKYDPTVNWTTGVDMDKNSPTYGRPRTVDQYSTEKQGEDHNNKGICPAALGTKDEQPAAYSPDTQLFYVPTSHVCMDYEPFKVSYTAGQPYVGATLSMYPPRGESNMGNFIAWDGKTGKIVWSNKEQFSVWSGALATAGGVVFYGNFEGYLKAVDAKTGKELYKFKTPSGIVGNVTTYEQGGKQYVAVLSGVGGWAGIGLAAGLTDPTAGLGAVGGYAALSNYTALGGSLTVFALSEGTGGGGGGGVAADALPPGVKALQPVYYATNRIVNNDAPLRVSSFTADRNTEGLKYGLTIVSIPGEHQSGNVERPFEISQALYQPWKIWRLLTDKESDREHFRIRGIEPLSREQFVDALRARTDPESILLFVHGYDTSFEDAIYKAAQIAYDASFKGHVVVFSWPSAGALLGYPYDQTSARFSKQHLLSVFQLLKEISGKHIYVVAHSLGNQIVVDALDEAASKKIDLPISELVMAAPDVDRDVFMIDAKQIRPIAGNMTMYASSADKALRLSVAVAQAPRMGYIGPNGPNLAEGVETIDVTAVGEDMLAINHSTSSTSREVLNDIGLLIRLKSHQTPEERSAIVKSKLSREQMKYWYYPQ